METAEEIISIVIVDDHRLFNDGLRSMLSTEHQVKVVAQVYDSRDAEQTIMALKPGVALIDFNMPHINGIELTKTLVTRAPDIKVLILSMYSDERYVNRAVRAGARGYLLKDTVEEDLIEAIHQIHEGQPFFSPSVAQLFQQAHSRDMQTNRLDDRYELLTERERQLYHMLAEGKSNKEIAARLSLSLHTVETHRTRIMEKLGIHSIAELVLSAVRRGIIVYPQNL